MLFTKIATNTSALRRRFWAYMHWTITLPSLFIYSFRSLTLFLKKVKNSMTVYLEFPWGSARRCWHLNHQLKSWKFVAFTYHVKIWARSQVSANFADLRDCLSNQFPAGSQTLSRPSVLWVILAAYDSIILALRSYFVCDTMKNLLTYQWSDEKSILGSVRGTFFHYNCFQDLSPRWGADTFPTVAQICMKHNH